MAKAIVTGWKELDAAFANLEPKIQGKALRSALRAGAQRIQAAAIQNIVNNPSVDTGKLASSFSVRAMPRSRTRVGMQILTNGAAHANIVEYGAKHMPAEPFLRPAGYDNKEYIAAMLLDDIANAAKDPAWKFKKSAAGDVTKARRSARKLVGSRKRIKKKAARKRKRDAVLRKRTKLREKKLAAASRKKLRTAQKKVTKKRNSELKRARAKAATARKRASVKRQREAVQVKKKAAAARKRVSAAKKKAADAAKKSRANASKKLAAQKKKAINAVIKKASRDRAALQRKRAKAKRKK